MPQVADDNPSRVIGADEMDAILDSDSDNKLTHLVGEEVLSTVFSDNHFRTATTLLPRKATVKKLLTKPLLKPDLPVCMPKCNHELVFIRIHCE